ncbi:MAG: hypothetical protein R2745_18405 [Vicinamibacterales bacterium]
MLAPLAGVLAGALHVVAGPDHLAAVAPLVANDDRPAWRAGFAWGLGHTAGVMLVGLLLLAFRELLPVEALSAWSERMVGAALVSVGAWGLWRAHAGASHSHASGTPSFAMGTLHGLAGSAHLYGVLPSLMFASRADAVAYLGGFGAGAVMAMTGFAALVGAVSLVGGGAAGPLRRVVLVAASTAAVVVGGAWLLT